MPLRLSSKSLDTFYELMNLKIESFKPTKSACRMIRFSIRTNTPMKILSTGNLFSFSGQGEGFQFLPSNLTLFCRHVILPPEMAKLVPRTHLMTETEWRNLGVQQSPGWVHYMSHQPGKTILFPKCIASSLQLCIPLIILQTNFTLTCLSFFASVFQGSFSKCYWLFEYKLHSSISFKNHLKHGFILH